MRGAGFSPIHGHASFSAPFKHTDKHVCVSLGLFSGRGQRPLQACPKDLTGWEGAGQSMCQEIQRTRHNCDSGLFPKRAHLEDSLDRSHPRSFLEGIELQESGTWPRRRRRLQRASSARQAGRPCRQGLLSVGPTPTFPHPPPAGPRRIASFKCRKLSSQVRASDFASSFSLLNGDPPHPAIPRLHLETAPSAPRGGRGLGDGEGGRGTDSPTCQAKGVSSFV